MIARLALVTAFAVAWVIGSTGATAPQKSGVSQMERRPAPLAEGNFPKVVMNETSIISPSRGTEAYRRRQERLQRKALKRQLKKQKRRERAKRREGKKGRKSSGKGGADKERKKRKKKKRNKKRKKRKEKRKRKKRKNKAKRKDKKKLMKKLMAGKGDSEKWKKKMKERKERKERRRQRKMAKRRKRKKQKKRKKRKNRKPYVMCKKDKDCEAAGPKYCCQFLTGRCVRPRRGLKCFGSCMCNARKRTENFLCVTKKKKYEKFLAQKAKGEITYEKPRGHCSNVNATVLQDPNHRYQQIL